MFQTNISKRFKGKVSLALGLSFFALALQGCGKQDFVKQEFSSDGSSVGYQVIPAKTDILIVTDNSASFSTPYYTFQSQISNLVNSLSAQGWDYHIAAIPIASDYASTIQTVLVDSEKNSPNLNNGLPNPSFTSSYSINSANAITNPAAFNPLFTINSRFGSSDQTFSNIVSALNQDANPTAAHFLRPDSLFAVIVITNGNDFSGSTIQDWSNRILSASQRPLGSTLRTTNKVRFYAIASQVWRSSGCWNDGADAGTRYFQMASTFNSPTGYDFCTSNVSDVIQDIASNLNIQKRAYTTRAIFLGVPPVPSSIQIKKVLSTGASYTIPNDATNGWTYTEAGQPKTDFTILQPYSLDQRTGYMIELHGSGQIRGDEQYSITYQRR